MPATGLYPKTRPVLLYYFGVIFADTYFQEFGKMNLYITNLLEVIVSLLPKLLFAVLILVISIYIGKLLGNLVRKVLKRHQADAGVTSLLSSLTRWVVILAGILMALQRFFDVTAFLAGLGILGFTVGFALQNIMQNFAAGVILLVQQPFRVGEVIEAGGYVGTVLAVNLRTSEMRTLDGRLVSIPNSSILNNPIVNFTQAERRRVDLPFSVAYKTDLDMARVAALEAVKNIPGFVSDPAPMVVYDLVSGGAASLNLSFWVDMHQTNLADAKDAAIRSLKGALEQKGIELPVSTQTIFLHSQD